MGPDTGHASEPFKGVQGRVWGLGFRVLGVEVSFQLALSKNLT